ncbi:MAG: lysophospholipid acyltransferase family protein [Alphaproteobacteria bacterium]
MGWQRLAPMHMLISAHRDGQIIAEAIAYFGVQSISGSTRRGGSAALRRMLKRLDAGECVGITPDGPRGPAMTVSSGIVNLARLASAPIVPIVCATSRRKVLNSWDRFHLALPFGRGVFLWGEPVEIASDLDPAGLEDARHRLEIRMNEMAREADRLVGHFTTLQNHNQLRLACLNETPAGALPKETHPVPTHSAGPIEEQLPAEGGQRS